jgi:curved DNA-binding protein CbpA
VKKRRDPYEVLGVPRKATDDQLKKAYRKRARETHPDVAGGGSEPFQEVHAAFALLKDRERRADFDATGNQDAPAPARWMEPLGIAFQEVMAEYLNGSPAPIVETILKQLRTMRQNLRGTLQKNEVRMKRLSKLIGKVKFRGEGQNVFGDEIAHAHEQMVAAGRELKSKLEDLDHAIEVAGQYDFPSMFEELQISFAGAYDPTPRKWNYKIYGDEI